MVAATIFEAAAGGTFWVVGCRYRRAAPFHFSQPPTDLEFVCRPVRIEKHSIA